MKKLGTECESKCSLPHESWDAGNSGDGRDSSVASVGQSWEGWGSGGSVGNGTLGSQVGSSGGLDGGLVHGDHGAIGVAHQLGVQVQGAGVAWKYISLERKINKQRHFSFFSLLSHCLKSEIHYIINSYE